MGLDGTHLDGGSGRGVGRKVSSVDGVHDAKVVLSQSQISSNFHQYKIPHQLAMFWRTTASQCTSVMVQVGVGKRYVQTVVLTTWERSAPAPLTTSERFLRAWICVQLYQHTIHDAARPLPRLRAPELAAATYSLSLNASLHDLHRLGNEGDASREEDERVRLRCLAVDAYVGVLASSEKGRESEWMGPAEDGDAARALRVERRKWGQMVGGLPVRANGRGSSGGSDHSVLVGHVGGGSVGWR